MSKQWQIHQSLQESLCSQLNKDEILEEFLQFCNHAAIEDQNSIKSLNSKLQTIKKHYAQQKCRIDHQFKYIQTLLEQKRKELITQLNNHEQELDKTFRNILGEITQIQSVVDNIQNDILSNRQEIVSEVDDETFHNILTQFDQQISMAQSYKKELLSSKINLMIIEEWTSTHQDVIKNLLNSTITIKDYSKQIETQHSELSASTCSDKLHSNRSSQELPIKQTPLIISFDQKYFMQQKSAEITKSDSEIHDSCESDFLREWAEQ